MHLVVEIVTENQTTKEEHIVRLKENLQSSDSSASRLSVTK